MSGDPSRRPSNERVRTAHIASTVRIQCRICLGDGWSYPAFGARRYKITCSICAGTGVAETLLLDLRADDIRINTMGQALRR
jgi:hypothetical protein